MSITTTLVDWAWSLTADAVPAAVRHAACRHLLDGLGTAIAAQRTTAAPAATAVATSFTAPQEATIIATRTRVPAPAAALANGTAVHALDYDDTHAAGLVHATAAVLPATFAVAEATGASAVDTLTTAIAGYETVTRLAAAAPHRFHARGFHATSVCGVFAAALVAARLGGLTREEAVAALGIAGSQAAGSLEFLATGASTKQLHPGLAGAAGILAARLAAAGASAPASILEGSRGLYAAYADGAADLDGITRGLGDRWETTRITIKPYPACQLSHASLDALRDLAPKIGHPSEVAAIVVDVPTESVPIVCEPLDSKRHPRTLYEGKFSLPWSLAALLVDGGLGLASFEPASLDRPEVADLAERVTYRGVDDQSVAAADAPGRVEVTLTDGRTLTHEVERSRGGPDAPMSDDELLAKFSANCGADGALVAELATRVLHLDQELDLSGIVDLSARVLEGQP